MARGPSGARTSGLGPVPWLATLACLGPVAVFVAALGTRTGLWGLEVGFDLIALNLGRWMALVGLGAGALAMVLAAPAPRRRGPVAALALAIALVFAGGLYFQQQRFATAHPNDVTTSPAEPPGPSDELAEIRRSDGAGPLNASVACPGVEAIPRQLAPESASAALERAGLTVIGAAAFRAEGFREGFWFGFTHDVIVRIRPGRTDVRVIARDGRPQGDTACGLLRRVTTELAKEP